MSLLPLIVGSVFFAFGAFQILDFLRFRNKGIKIKGRVKAIEKYVSKTRGTGNSQTSSLMFRAIVE